jgi:hypothetical protein
MRSSKLARNTIHCSPASFLSYRRGVKHLPGTGPHKPLLLLVNFDWALEPARPVGPSTKYLGALMPRPPQQLPEELRAWLEAPSEQPGRAAALCEVPGIATFDTVVLLTLALRASTTTRLLGRNLFAGVFVQHLSAQYLSGVYNFSHFLVSSLTLLHGSHCDQESNYLISGCAK